MKLPTNLIPMSHRAVKVAILGINYVPEPTGIAPYTAGIAEGLTKRGHDVLVLTGQPHYPYWERGTESSRFRSEEQIHGVRVRRLRHPVPRRLSWRARGVMELVFGLQIATSRWGNPDVVICVTPPLLAAAITALRVKFFRRKPALGILVQDLYGRGVEEIGAASGFLARLIRAVESKTLRSSDGVSVIHTGFAQEVSNDLGVDSDRIREIRNWTHVDAPDPSASEAFRLSQGWGPEEIVVLHAGNMGYKQGLENVVAAAKLASGSSPAVRFVLLGAGNQRTHLEVLAAGVKGLQFLPPLDEEDFPAALGAADILLVNERPGVANMSVPSKLTSYFKARKPILAATDSTGFTAVELAASGAGVCVPADRPDMLLREALRLGSDKQLASLLGESGGRYCERLLSEAEALDRYERWVIGLAGK